MLAWRRSTLSLVVGALIVGRLALGDEAPVVAVVCIVAAVMALWLALASLRSRRWSVASTVEPEFELLLRNGVLPAALALVAGSLCLAELALSLGLLG